MRSSFFRQRLSLLGQPADPSLKSVPPAMQFDVQSGRAMDPSIAAGPSTCSDCSLACISERLACRVKGLTAVFCVLLLTSPVLPAARRVFAIKLWLRHNVLDNANA